MPAPLGREPTRTPRFRLTVGGLMAIVAAVAVTLGACLASLRMTRWSAACDARAREHARAEAAEEAEETRLRRQLPKVRDEASAYREMGERIKLGESLRSKPKSSLAESASARRLGRAELLIESADRRVRALEARIAAAARRRDYHARLRTKYEWAAAYPWLPASPDPPPPG